MTGVSALVRMRKQLFPLLPEKIIPKEHFTLTVVCQLIKAHPLLVSDEEKKRGNSSLASAKP